MVAPVRSLAQRYVPEFRCTGGDCPDSCCRAGWRINVDEGHYRKLKRALGEVALVKELVVLGIAVFGALFVRFDAARLVRVMETTAAAQAVTAVIALAVDGAYIFVITGVFVAAWLFAAELFRRAAAASNAP